MYPTLNKVSKKKKKKKKRHESFASINIYKGVVAQWCNPLTLQPE